MTLDDLERPAHYALYYITCLSFGAHHKNLNADTHTVSSRNVVQWM